MQLRIHTVPARDERMELIRKGIYDVHEMRCVITDLYILRVALDPNESEKKKDRVGEEIG